MPWTVGDSALCPRLTPGTLLDGGRARESESDRGLSVREEAG